MIKYCRYCDIEIPNKSGQWSSQVYCTARCRKYAHRKNKSLLTRVERKRANLLQNDEILYLIKQCKRAKTVEVLKGHTLDSFIETIDLVKNRPAGDVMLCHIVPVKGEGVTGLFHCRNLFYGGSYQNRKFSQNYFSGGLFISNNKLLQKWKVTSDMKNNEVLLMIEEYLKDVISEYILVCPVRKSKKVKVIEKIISMDESVRFDELITYSYSSLQKQWATISRSKEYTIGPAIESKYLAYMDGLTRFISYGGERAVMLKRLRRIMVIGYMSLERVKRSQTYNKYFYVKYEPLINKKYGQAMLRDADDWAVLKDIIYNCAFNVLQGDVVDIKRFRKLVMSYLVFPEKACSIW